MNKLKKEISKEAMFNKIMPSGPLNHTVAPNVKSSGAKYVALEDDRDQRAAAAIARRDAEEMPELADEIKQNTTETQTVCEDEKEEETKESNSIKIVNIHAKMIEMKIDEAMEKFDCCTCTACRKNILCNALNEIKPKYMPVTESDIDKIIEKEDFTEVTAALMKSILELKKNPIH